MWVREGLGMNPLRVREGFGINPLGIRLGVQRGFRGGSERNLPGFPAAEPFEGDGQYPYRTRRMISPPWRIASSFCGSIFHARSGSDFFRPTITFSISTTGQTFR